MGVAQARVLEVGSREGVSVSNGDIYVLNWTWSLLNELNKKTFTRKPWLARHGVVHFDYRIRTKR